jgi:ribosomal protein L28
MINIRSLLIEILHILQESLKENLNNQLKVRREKPNLKLKRKTQMKLKQLIAIKVSQKKLKFLQKN